MNKIAFVFAIVAISYSCNTPDSPTPTTPAPAPTKIVTVNVEDSPNEMAANEVEDCDANTQAGAKSDVAVTDMVSCYFQMQNAQSGSYRTTYSFTDYYFATKPSDADLTAWQFGGPITGFTSKRVILTKNKQLTKQKKFKVGWHVFEHITGGAIQPGLLLEVKTGLPYRQCFHGSEAFCDDIGRTGIIRIRVKGNYPVNATYAQWYKRNNMTWVQFLAWVKTQSYQDLNGYFEGSYVNLNWSSGMKSFAYRTNIEESSAKGYVTTSDFKQGIDFDLTVKKGKTFTFNYTNLAK